jgi:hypothetical protein
MIEQHARRVKTDHEILDLEEEDINTQLDRHVHMLYNVTWYMCILLQ